MAEHAFVDHSFEKMRAARRPVFMCENIIMSIKPFAKQCFLDSDWRDPQQAM